MDGRCCLEKGKHAPSRADNPTSLFVLKSVLPPHSHLPEPLWRPSQSNPLNRRFPIRRDLDGRGQDAERQKNMSLDCLAFHCHRIRDCIIDCSSPCRITCFLLFIPIRYPIATMKFLPIALFAAGVLPTASAFSSLGMLELLAHITCFIVRFERSYLTRHFPRIICSPAPPTRLP